MSAYYLTNPLSARSFLRLRLIALVVTLGFVCPALRAEESTKPSATVEQVTLHRVQQDVEIARLLHALQADAPYGKIVIKNVNVVNPDLETVTPGQTVVVSDGRITSVTESSKVKVDPSWTTIAGNDRFIVPGLTDMHVHSSSAAGWLLDLANGVTTVREMAGFPWLLKLRDNVKAGRMLAPYDYVAGNIISGMPLQGYAVVPKDAEEARRIVKQQAACGYDFIKVHNIVPIAMFDAIVEEAHKLNLDVVGHVPHDISLEHALHFGRMRTTEHLKGFIIDQTLSPSEEDFAKALEGAETWITPTLYSRLEFERGENGAAVLASPMAKYVPQRRRDNWEALLTAPATSQSRRRAEHLGGHFRESQEGVMKRLQPLHPRWLAGTDADNYPFNIMGYALIEELHLLEQAGLTRAETLRAATSEPARALRRSNEFGLVQPGMRADLVLLSINPLQKGSEAFRTNEGVMAHGYWLDRIKLSSALEKLAAIFSQPDIGVAISSEEGSRLVAELKDLVAGGFVFDSSELIELAGVFEKHDGARIAAELRTLAVNPETGPCAAFLPQN